MAACVVEDGQVLQPQIRTESVEFEPVEVLHARIDMPAGELRVSGGAAELMSGEFAFTSTGLEPKLDYESSGVQGRLHVHPVHEGKSPGLSGPNRWEVLLNDDIPTDLKVHIGAGEARLDLGGMTLRQVDLEMGVGECDLDLVGEWTRNLEIQVRGGIGELDVRVPNSVGVVAEARGGLGEINVRGLSKRGDKYVNEAYGDASVTLTLEVHGGIGEISITAVE